MNRSSTTPLLLRCLLISLIFLVYMSAMAQNPYAMPVAAYDYGGDGNAITSNVPLNEINIRAFRHFRKSFPAISGERWLKTDGGYIVSFMKNERRNQAHYDLKGVFLYTVIYYSGKDIPAEASTQIKRKYPNYSIDLVAEISDGEKTFYMATIENASSVKTFSLCDGKIDLVEDFVNAR